jgi:tetratricopeptide (TPR) repeat protein
MKKLWKIFMLTVVLSANSNAAEVAGESPCDFHYAAALALMDDGKYIEAATELERAIQITSEPRLADGEYLPYIQLAVANFKAERFSSARQALIKSQVHGMAATSETGEKLIKRYATRIMTAPATNDEPLLTQSMATSYQDLQPGQYVISDENAQLIRSAVLRRCAVSEDVEDNKLPWYFHYEYGVDLMEAGDPQRALETLVLGANIREQSKRNKRMYGMWFIDYLPYYQIALAHSKLGNWESAYDAIKISATFGEFQPGDDDYEQFSRLDEEIRFHLNKNGS